MSNHPYGLRGDPFASPATLSPKDASRLIRRRVRAFNGDGGTLFPIDTCDLIHELTGGVPDATLALAGKAMAVAAAEGAPAVSPAHVRKAAETAADVVRVEPASTVIAAVAPAPPDREAARAARAIDALIEAADEGVRDDPTTGSYDDIPADEAQAVEAAPDDDDAVVAMSDTGDPGAAAAFEDDDDLPPFIPASIALPSRPSEGLDQGAREWVSRFISAPGAGPAAVSTPPPAVRPARQAARPAPRATRTEHVPEPVRAAPAPSRRPRPHAPRRRRRSGSQGLLIAVAAVCITAFVVRMSLRGALVPPSTEPARPTPTSAPWVEPPGADPEPTPTPAVREPAPSHAPGPGVPARPEPAPIPDPQPRTSKPPDPASVTGGAPPSVEPARRAAPAGTFGLEVATFIFEERARVERERLAAAGLRARIVTTLEYGSRVYRVVLGGYPHPAAAERAADSLLSIGVVLQARVVRVTFGT